MQVNFHHPKSITDVWPNVALFATFTPPLPQGNWVSLGFLDGFYCGPAQLTTNRCSSSQ